MKILFLSLFIVSSIHATSIIGVDFNISAGSNTPTNWNGVVVPSGTNTFTNLINENGQSTSIGLRTNASPTNLSTTFTAAEVPTHTTALFPGIDDAWRQNSANFMTWTGLTAGASYELYIFTPFIGDADNEVTITGDTQTSFITSFTPGVNELDINGQDGLSANSLSSYAIIMNANASGEIDIQVGEFPDGVGFTAVSAVAIREVSAAVPEPSTYFAFILFGLLIFRSKKHR
ncbi:hypothetical protein [Candidatus Uabimicrobium amorphum]|uniref:PEP-CTERM protein-sorting domain-containing protein n=1 Tax=Uabimicrobium amorphum TaxID=2596890 RepID=A0A5S9F388_UABAM|nr:hypothetical protein [Candidatus Uabimicrobium amorphum]BBM84485.1 hypothetical protein UABAM_02846 [Candidatus Uabimicrobium amorphum]